MRQLQMRVPADVLARGAGRSFVVTLPACETAPEEMVRVTIRRVIKLSLRVRDPVSAKMRVAHVTAQLERMFSSLRAKAVLLTHKQTVALAGEAYRLIVKRYEDNPGQSEDWEAWKGFSWGALEGRISDPPSIDLLQASNERELASRLFGVSDGPELLDAIERLPEGDASRPLEARFGAIADIILAQEALHITHESRLSLLRQVAEAALQAGWVLKRGAQGDYSPDQQATRFPPLIRSSGGGQLTLTALFERWKTETKPSPSTLATWRPVIKSLIEHLSHEIVERIASNDIVAWKDALLSTGRSPKNINNTYLACARAILAHAKQNGLIEQNVTTGISIKQKRVAGQSMLPYEDWEVAQLLALAANQIHAARRWIPLLAACTGARAGELAQLWAERVREIDGVLALELRPAEDGGTFKNAGSERVVPIHSALVDSGFLDFVEQKRAGPLFYGKNEGSGDRHASKGTINHLASWIRKQPGFDNPRKAPNHALRHWWKSAASLAGIQDSRADFIQGHRTPGEASRYRHMGLKSLAVDIENISIPLRWPEVPYSRR